MPFLWLAASRPAAAQVIDEYLQAGIPGYDTAAGVTVTTRDHPGFDAPGVRLGSFVLSPVLAESLGYDDNVTGTSHGHASALIETDASVTAAGGSAETRLDAALSVDDLEYPEQSGQGYTNWTAALGASHDFGRDTLSVGFSHLNLNQTPRDLDVPGLDSTIAYRVEDGRANYHIDLGHVFFQPGIDVSYFSFDNGRVGGQPYPQTYRDRVVVSPEVIGSYEIATQWRAVLILRDTQADYDRAPPGQPRQNFNDASVRGGLAYDPDGLIGLRLLAGYEERSFAASLYRQIQAPIVEASATWTPTGLTTLTGTASRYIEDSAAELTVGYTETALKLQLDHELYRNVIVTLHGAYTTDDYGTARGGTGGSQDFVTAGLGAQWQLDRIFRLTGDYTFSTREAGSQTGLPPQVFNTVGEVFGGNYSENTFRITLRAGL